jgi:hypothetical protein
LVTYPAALDLPHALVEWVTMPIVTREGDRRCKLRPSQHAVIALVYLREHTTYAKLAAGFHISEGTHLRAERDQAPRREGTVPGPSPSPSATRIRVGGRHHRRM